MKTQQVIPDDIRVCDDCVVYFASGEYPEDTTPEQDAELDECMTEMHDTYRFLGLGEPAGFSWATCDCCGADAGNRTYLTYVDGE